MNRFIRILSLSSMAIILLTGIYAQTPRLSGSNLMLDDNTLDIHLGVDGVIDFIKATFFPGEGLSNIYLLDIAKDRSGIHGQGVATNEAIIKSGPKSFTVKSPSRIPVNVRIETKAVILTIGHEHFAIRKIGKDFEVEIRPLAPDGVPLKDKALSYRITLSPKPSFLGFTSKSYLPKYSFENRTALDPEAIYIINRITQDKRTLTAYGFSVQDDQYPEFKYTYQFPFSKDKQVNLDNYLILLTQRQADGMIPLIHPVLLTIYFFDSIMP